MELGVRITTVFKAGGSVTYQGSQDADGRFILQTEDGDQTTIRAYAGKVALDAAFDYACFYRDHIYTEVNRVIG